MLLTRVLTALVLLPAVAAALFLLPPRGWGAAALAAIAVGAAEWAALARFSRAGRAAFVAATLAAGVLLLAAAGPGRPWPDPVVGLGCGFATLFWLLVAPRWLGAHAVARTPAGMALAGIVVLVGAWIAVVDLQARSPWVVLAAMAIVWVADTAAYFAGRAFGRRKLAPSISPGKTWEGVAGGLLAVAVYAALLLSPAAAHGAAGPRGPWGAAAFVAFAVAVAALSVVGDLTESLVKRLAGVKDSGRLLPGHGGVLDRTDALLAAMPPVALAALAFLR